MPFTIGGQWVPSKNSVNVNSKLVKVRVTKRGKSILTLVLNLGLPAPELADLVSALKKKLGCGGSVKDQVVEIQGDKLSEVVKFLNDRGIKTH